VYSLEASVGFIWTNELFRLWKYLLDAVSHNWTHRQSVTQYSILKDIENKMDAVDAARPTIDEFWLDLIEEYSGTVANFRSLTLRTSLMLTTTPFKQDVAHGFSLMRALHEYDVPFPRIPELEDVSFPAYLWF